MKKKKLKTTSRKTSATGKRTKRARPASKVAVALKATVLKGKPAKAQLRHIPWSSVEVEALNPLLGRHFVVGQNVMLARVLLKKGCVVPEHSHHNEQITYILEGVLRFRLGDDESQQVDVAAGEVLHIPADLPHTAVALEDTLDVDIFSPPREDWLDGSDAYLRATPPA